MTTLPSSTNLLFLLEGDGLGGVERITSQLVQILAKPGSGIRPGLFIASPRTGFQGFEPAPCVHGDWQRLESELMVRALPRIVRAIRETAAGLAPDTVVVATSANLVIAAFLAGLRERTVYWSHADYPRFTQPLPLRAHIAHTVAASGARYLFSLDDTLLARFPMGLGRRLGLSVTNPFIAPKPEDYRPETLVNQEAWHKVQTSGKPYVLFLGRLAPQWKHPEVMIGLARSRPDYQFVIVGDGPMRDDLDFEALGMGNVVLAGAEPNPAPWLRGASALVLPSEREAWPTVVSEALWEGVPVVTTDCTPAYARMLPGELGQCIVQSRDELGPALERALRRETRTLFIQRGRQVLDMASPDKVLDQWQLALRRVRETLPPTARTNEPPVRR